MNVSVSDPMGWAMTRTTRILFKPFSMGKWFVLGLSAFLAQLGEGGEGNLGNLVDLLPGGGGVPGGGPPPGPRGMPSDPVAAFIAQIYRLFLQQAHWVLPVILVGVILLVVILWLRARGKFIFLDGVARNHAAIVEPWSRLAAPANSFFRFDLTIILITTVSVLAVGLLTYLIGLPDLRSRQFTASGITAITVGAVLLVLLIVGYLLVTAVAENFLLPLMYLRGPGVAGAWREFRTAILPGHVGIILAYFLLRGVLNIAVATLMMFGTCLTCFLAAIPYLGTVIFLPLFVFLRAYSLLFLQQFGPGYQIIHDEDANVIRAFPVIFSAPPEQPEAPPPLPVPLPPTVSPEGGPRDV